MQALVGGAGIPTPEVGFQSERKQDPFSRNHSVGLNILMCPAHDRAYQLVRSALGNLKVAEQTERRHGPGGRNPGSWSSLAHQLAV